MISHHSILAIYYGQYINFCSSLIYYVVRVLHMCTSKPTDSVESNWKVLLWNWICLFIVCLLGIQS